MELNLDLINVYNANPSFEGPSTQNVFHYSPFYKLWETQLFIISGNCTNIFTFCNFHWKHNFLKLYIFSLDVEGSELQILKSIPFEKVDIKVLDIEHKHMGDIFPGSFQELKAFLELKGYDYHMQIRDPLGYPNDVVFVKRGFLNEIKEMQNKMNDEL